MPAKVWHLNSWFELELESLVRTGTLPIYNRQKENRNRFLERLFLSSAPLDDSVILTHPIPRSLLDHWEENHWKIAKPIFMDPKNPTPHLFPSGDWELVEFGRVREIENGRIDLPLTAAEPSSLEYEQKSDVWKSSAFFNSRVLQTEYSIDTSFGDEGLRVLRTKEDLEDFLAGWAESQVPMIFKKEYTSSGRGHSLLDSMKGLHKMGKFDFPIVGELYSKEREYDFGMLFDSVQGNLKLLDTSHMLIGDNFQFKGLLFYPDRKPSWMEEAIQLVLEERNFPDHWKNFTGEYSGPVALDGFLCRDGNHRARSEINYRYSIGRIAYEIRQRILDSDYISSSKKSNQKNRPLDNPSSYGIFILHDREVLEPKPEFEIILSRSETEPWRVLYIESTSPTVGLSV
jgi:hypothetical protein